jgi:hypothetical protein
MDSEPDNGTRGQADVADLLASRIDLTFVGRVHPERAPLTVSPPIPFELQTVAGGNLPATVSILASQIIVSLNRIDGPVDLFTLRNVVASLVSSIADVAGWLHGYAYQVEMTAVTGPNTYQTFGIDVPVLVAAAETSRVKDVAAILQLTTGPNGAYLRRALADFRMAMLAPDDTAFYCYRAVESLRRSFGATKGGRRAGLSTSLRIDDSWLIVYLERPANDVRHGGVAPVTDEDRQRLLLAAHEVIERYIVLRSSGESRVPPEVKRLRVDDDPLRLLAQSARSTAVASDSDEPAARTSAQIPEQPT